MNLKQTIIIAAITALIVVGVMSLMGQRQTPDRLVGTGAVASGLQSIYHIGAAGTRWVNNDDGTTGNTVGNSQQYIVTDIPQSRYPDLLGRPDLLNKITSPATTTDNISTTSNSIFLPGVNFPGAGNGPDSPFATTTLPVIPLNGANSLTVGLTLVASNTNVIVHHQFQGSNDGVTFYGLPLLPMVDADNTAVTGGAQNEAGKIATSRFASGTIISISPENSTLLQTSISFDLKEVHYRYIRTLVAGRVASSSAFYEYTLSNTGR
jgi:hypothetical protein